MVEVNVKTIEQMLASFDLSDLPEHISVEEELKGLHKYLYYGPVRVRDSNKLLYERRDIAEARRAYAWTNKGEASRMRARGFTEQEIETQLQGPKEFRDRNSPFYREQD
ncbi:hypothetical protein JXB28_02630 [Candidatus Woesearchaeota archaeon]|nr:hypothetical protein [Candidatus Woesearchaeota archaeon]